jgi:membrane protease YdiL (CAAX protease family)
MPRELPLLFGFLLVTIVVIANFAENGPNLIPVVNGLLLVLNGLFVLNYGTEPISQLGDRRFSETALPVAIVFAAAATAVLSSRLRERIALLFAQGNAAERNYNPRSPVHLVALIFCIYLFGMTVSQFVQVGGLRGLAEQFQTPTTDSLWLQAIVLIAFAMLGVGLGIRRSLTATLSRLGLRAPTISELGITIGVALLLFGIQFTISAVWQSVTPPEVFREQQAVSEILSNSLNTLSAAFVLSLTAALGEEIAFRGALQPIFGLVPTTILFALIHIQYTLTPATLIIIAVGFGLGWLRRKFNTTAAILGHFLYNFMLIAFALYGRYLIDTLGVNR